MTPETTSPDPAQGPTEAGTMTMSVADTPERGELEVAALLQDLLGTAVTRNLTQTRDGGHDLVGFMNDIPAAFTGHVSLVYVGSRA